MSNQTEELRKLCDCNQGRLPCTCKDTTPLIQTLHANGDRIAMEATIAQQAQRIADLERGRGVPFTWMRIDVDGRPYCCRAEDHGDSFPVYREPPAPVPADPEYSRCESCNALWSTRVFDLNDGKCPSCDKVKELNQ